MSQNATLIPASDILRAENQKYYEFINLGLSLAVLTGIEIVVIFFPWNPHLIFWILVVLSVIKFGCVIAWFMHLIYDRLLLSLIFLAALVVATGTAVALMMLFSARHVDYEAISFGL